MTIMKLAPFKSWIATHSRNKTAAPGAVQTAFTNYARLSPGLRSSSVRDILCGSDLDIDQAAVTACMMNLNDLAVGIKQLTGDSDKTFITHVLSSDIMADEALEHVWSLMGRQSSESLLSFADQKWKLEASMPFGKTWRPEIPRDLTDHVRHAKGFLDRFNNGKNPEASLDVVTFYGEDSYSLTMFTHDISTTLSMIRRIAASDDRTGVKCDRAWATAIGNLPTIRALGYFAVSSLAVEDIFRIVTVLSGKD